jgi:hypothetical protein
MRLVEKLVIVQAQFTLDLEGSRDWRNLNGWKSTWRPTWQHVDNVHGLLDVALGYQKRC